MSDGEERNIPENSVGQDEEAREVDNHQGDARGARDIGSLLAPLLIPAEENVVALSQESTSQLKGDKKDEYIPQGQCSQPPELSSLQREHLGVYGGLIRDELVK